MTKRHVSLRRAAMLGCASALVLTATTAPSRAAQDVIKFFVNGTPANDITQNSGNNVVSTGCCATYVGPAQSGAPGFLSQPPPPLTGGFSTTSSGVGAVSEGSAVGGSGRDDQFDGYGGVGMRGAANFAGLTVTRNTQATLGANNAVGPAMTGFAAAGIPNALRFVETLTNNTNATVTGTFAYFNNLGSDSNTIYVNKDPNNRFIQSYQNTFGPNAGTPLGSTSDVISTHILGNNAYVKNNVTITSTSGGPLLNGDDNPSWNFPVTIAPGKTVRVVIFNIATSDTDPDASVQSDLNVGLAQANILLNNGGRIARNSPFFAGLTFADLMTIINWDFQVSVAAGLPTGAPINAVNVANAFDVFANNGGVLPPGFDALSTLTGTALVDALLRVSGEPATGAQQGAFDLGNYFLALMLDPFVDGRNGLDGANGGGVAGFAPERPVFAADIALAYAKMMHRKAPVAPEPTLSERWNIWGSVYGGVNQTKGNLAVVGSHDLTARAGGFAAGLDYKITPNTKIGFAVAGAATNWSLASALGGGASDAFHAGVYGVTRTGPAYLAASLAYTQHWMTTNRTAFAGNVLKGTFNAESFGGRIEGGYRFVSPMTQVGITPYVALQAQSFRMPGYSEVDVNGGGFALTYNGRTATDVRTELGSRFDRTIPVSVDTQLVLRGRVAWAHDWVSDPSLAATFQALPGATFIVNGATPAKDSALVSAGAQLRFKTGWSLSGKFDGAFAQNSKTYSGLGTIAYSW